MKIVFFGLGSIGQRHSKILLKNYKYDLFAFRSGVDSQKNNLDIKELHSWKEVERLKPDVAFITNPTYLHIETAIECAEIGCKLFIEKPIDRDLNGLDKLLKIVRNKNLVTYVAYNLRFHPVILALKRYMRDRKPLHVRVVCTSYLPSWRSAEDYLRSYSANTRMGGGVILDLSHELDYVSYLLDGVKRISGNFGRVGKMTVDAEDYADMLLETDFCPVSIHVDFLSHLRQRYIQMDFDDLTVVADLINAEIKEYKNESLHENKRLDYDEGQEYTNQIKYFFDNIENPKMMNNLIEAQDLFRKIINFKNTKNE